MGSDERERTVENPSLTLTETQTETATVLRPLPIEPAPLTSSYTKIELTPPISSSYTKVEPTPPLNTSNANVEPDYPPITSSYKKVEPSCPSCNSSYKKVESTPPPLTTSYKKKAIQLKEVEEKKTNEDFEVQKACMNFEKYIMEMLLEEREVRDLLDVEELMYCTDKLKSPVFIELVCTFYGELCLDLFSNEGDQSVLEASGNY